MYWYQLYLLCLLHLLRYLLRQWLLHKSQTAHHYTRP
jgi:hypothetical protein